jgi:hypothetical protein
LVLENNRFLYVPPKNTKNWNYNLLILKYIY